MNLTMDPTHRLEIGFGRVVEGKEAWMYGEYFPKFGPLMAGYGLRTVVSFAVLDSNVDSIEPVQGSLSSWPSAQRRVDLHEDPDFAAILPARDAALRLSDGHLFEPLPHPVQVDTDGEFALIISEAEPAGALFRVPLAADTANSAFAGRSLSLVPWSEAAQDLLAGAPERATVLRVRLNPPRA